MKERAFFSALTLANPLSFDHLASAPANLFSVARHVCGIRSFVAPISASTFLPHTTTAVPFLCSSILFHRRPSLRLSPAEFARARSVSVHPLDRTQRVIFDLIFKRISSKGIYVNILNREINSII